MLHNENVSEIPSHSSRLQVVHAGTGTCDIGIVHDQSSLVADW